MGIKEAILDLKENKRSMMLAISSVVIIVLIALFLLYFFFYQKPVPQDVDCLLYTSDAADECVNV